LWPCLNALRPNNAHHELYLTDAIAMLRERNERVLAQTAAEAEQILGCNTRVQLADADRILRTHKAEELMDAGVTIYLPETVVIDAEVTAGPDTIIEPCVQLLGATRLGARCKIQTGSVLHDTRVDDDATVLAHSVLDRSRLGEKASVGPFSRLRPGSDVRAGAHVGNFVEMKKSVIHEGSKAMHLTYLGDSTIGRNTNIGAGTITCNYDGVAKYQTTIGDRVFIGSDVALVAPVRVGDGAYVAAGSTITHNVPAGALAIARGRQENKVGWAVKRLQAMKKSKREKGRAKSKSRRKTARRAKRKSQTRRGGPRRRVKSRR
jgi:bifunctional UDP-N-acetylglucosamine pyrophosphorylase/glucosamine-1-phosphate N-acetyltransferase